MANEYSGDIGCVICGSTTEFGQSLCSDICREVYEEQIDEMYLAELEERENARQRQMPQERL